MRIQEIEPLSYLIPTTSTTSQNTTLHKPNMKCHPPLNRKNALLLFSYICNTTKEVKDQGGVKKTSWFLLRFMAGAEGEKGPKHRT